MLAFLPLLEQGFGASPGDAMMGPTDLGYWEMDLGEAAFDLGDLDLGESALVAQWLPAYSVAEGVHIGNPRNREECHEMCINKATPTKRYCAYQCNGCFLGTRRLFTGKASFDNCFQYALADPITLIPVPPAERCPVREPVTGSNCHVPSMSCPYQGQQWCCKSKSMEAKVIKKCLVKPQTVGFRTIMTTTWVNEYPDCSCGNPSPVPEKCTTHQTDIMECKNGQRCNVRVEGWGCCNHRHGRAKCPANNPWFCMEQDCGGDFCCSPSVGACKRGVNHDACGGGPAMLIRPGNTGRRLDELETATVEDDVADTE